MNEDGLRQRREEFRRLLERAQRWAAAEPDVEAVALVGSWARGQATMDSDIDFVVLTTAPTRYGTSEDWLCALAGEGACIVRTQQYGAVTERRVVVVSGLEIEYGFASTEWAATKPVDAGTARVVSDGLVVVYDPRNWLSMLLVAVRSTGGNPAT